MTRVLVLLALLSAPAWAYSPVQSEPGSLPSRYEVVRGSPPSDYEVVDATPRILVVRPEKAFRGGMRFEVEEVIKGEPLKHMHLHGSSDSFQAGHLYLTFLDREEDGWTFSKLVDEGIQAVESEDAWLRTVRLFAGISALDDPKQEKEALRELKAAAEDRDGRYPEGLAKRIANHFATPSSHKSFSDLMDLYQNAETDDERLAVLWGLFNSDHPETAGFFRSLLGEPDWLLQPVVTWLSLNPEELPRMADLARIYLGRPVGERALLLYLMLDAAEKEEDAALLWTLLPFSDRGEVRPIVEEALARPGVDLDRFAVPDDERVITDLLAVWLEVGTSSQVKERLEALLRRGQDPRWRRVEGLEELAAAFEISKDRAVRRDILLEVFSRTGDSSHLPLLWRLLLQARDREADLILEWVATRVPPYEALVELYRGAKSDEERNRALWVAGAAWRSDQLERLLAEVGGMGPGAARLERLTKAFLSCPSATARSSILGELENGLATAQDLPSMLEILRGTETWETVVLARWFAQHPSPEALPWLKRLPPHVIRDESWVTEALAAAGDPELLDQAIAAEPEDDPWAMNVVAWSPLPAAVEEARRVLREPGGSLGILLGALGEHGNSAPWREWFLGEVVRSSTVSANDRQQASWILQQQASSEPPRP